MRPVLGVLLIAGAVLISSSVRAQVPSMTYDAFMSLDGSERLARFGQLVPENQAALQREHLARWRTLRADSLTDEQQQLLEEVAASIQPEDYMPDRRHTTEDVRVFLDRSRRVSVLFTPEQAAEAFTLRGRRILTQ